MKTYLTALVAAIMMAACATPAIPYKPQASEKTARFNMNKFDSGSLDFCMDGKRYSAERGTDGYVTIPAGRNLTVSAFRSWQTYAGTYTITYSCRPAIGVLAEEGKRYFGNLEIRGQACYAEVYLEDATTPTGFDVVLPVKTERCEGR